MYPLVVDFMNISIEKFKSTFTTGFIILAIVVVIVLVLLFIFRKKIKRVSIPNVYLITGAVKTCKTASSVWFAWLTYIKNLIGYKLGKVLWIICKHTKEGYYEYAPMFYTNIPVKFKHNRLTFDIIMRKKRIPNKSVVLIDEGSLLADCMNFRDTFVNDSLTLFFKLFAHYTHGGTCIVNTQAVSDMHYAFRRAMGRYLYLYDNNRFPFFTVVRARELVASDDTGLVNQVASDLEESMRWVFVPFFVFKLYDKYCYSIFTDDLLYQVDYDYKFDKKDLKARQIISVNKTFRNLKPRGEEKKYE